ncbi:LGFP repeat-containing protein [Kineococcus terrestris]|uniref:LGFP repeat-containing protein n=1 Tax=Kineococcus terrestris TaxID=2044856 RepID=UPI0034DB61D3
MGRTRRSARRASAAAVLTAAVLGSGLLGAAPAGAATRDYPCGAGTCTVRGAVLDKYDSLGAERSRLGPPVTSEALLPAGAFSVFRGGSIYWTPGTGAHVVEGRIRDRWGSLGWEGGVLGWPTTDEIPIRGGVVQKFTGGLVYFSPATGAREVRGAILERYGATRNENGELGYPVSGENTLPGGAFTEFQGGSIYWSPRTGAHVVKGFIREWWVFGAGAEGGWLGYPRTGEYPVPGGVQQDFEGGQVRYILGDDRIQFRRW